MMKIHWHGKAALLLGSLALTAVLLTSCGSGSSLQSITVTPANPSVAKGLTQQFTATGNFTNGSRDISSSVTWASSDMTVATINSSGVASTLKVGPTTITATSGNVSGSTTLTVTAPVLMSITVAPANKTVVKGSLTQFTATGTLTDGSVQDVTSTVTWASSNTTTASITNGGLANALAQGSTTISATSGTVSGNTTLTVQVPPGVPRFGYVVNPGDNTISSFALDAATGQLHSIAYGFTGTASNSAQAVTADPFGRFVFVADNNDDAVDVFAVNAVTGALTRVAGSPFSTGAGSAPLWIAVGPSGRFIYTANSQTANVSGFSVDPTTGALTPVPGSPFPSSVAGSFPIYASVDPTGRYLYVANVNDDSVSGFAIDSTTGALTAVPNSPFATGVAPEGVVVDPSGQFVYAANSGDDSITGFSINAATGELTELLNSPFLLSTGVEPASVTVDPSGKFLFAPDSFSNDVSVFSIAANGDLNEIANSPFPADNTPFLMAIDQSGKFAYVANSGGNSLSVYSINSGTGDLTELGTQIARSGAIAVGILAGNAPVSITPQFAYTANQGSGNVSAYSVNSSSGALAAIAGSPSTAGATPTSVAVDPQGRFAYVTNSGGTTVSVFTINATTGALAAATPATMTVGTAPNAAVVDLSGRFLYVANKGSNDISVFTIDQSTGALTAVGAPVSTAGQAPVDLVVDPSGQFLYVSYAGSAPATGSGVVAFSINASSGALTELLPGIVTTPAQGASIAVDPWGSYLYVADSSSNRIDALTINPFSGQISGTVTGSPFAGENATFAVSVDPSGRFLYTGGTVTKNVLGYSITRSTGALTAVTGSPFITTGVPRSLAADPSGKFLYEPDFGGTTILGFTINANGSITAMSSPFAAGTSPINLAFTRKIQ